MSKKKGGEMKTPDFHCKKCNWTGDVKDQREPPNSIFCPDCGENALEPYWEYEARINEETRSKAAIKADKEWKKKQNNGRPAFPMPLPVGGILDRSNQGLTVRQWYAGKALGWHGCWTKDPKNTAERCFGVADAMIEFEENEKGREK